MREWIHAVDQDTNVYLIRVTNGATLVGWQRADASGVISVLRDQAYASFIDEDSDDISVSILTECGILPVTVKLETEVGLVGVTLSYRDPLKRGEASYVVADTGAYPLMGA